MKPRLHIPLVWVTLMIASPQVGVADDGGPKEENPESGDTDEVAGILEDALTKLAVTKNAEALERLEENDYPGALNLIQEAFDLDSSNPEIVNNYGYIYYLLGNEQEAERLLRMALDLDPKRFMAHVNLADILGREGENSTRLAEASALLKRARELKGNRADVILKQARVAKLQGAYEETERYYDSYVKIRKPTDRLKLEIGDFFRDLGRNDEALLWYQRVENKKALGKEAAGRIWDIEVERQAKQFGWSLPPRSISGKARILASRGQVQLSRGNLSEAERLLKEAVTLAPGFAKARMYLGDVYKATGRFNAAELAFLRALSVENNAETCFRLGSLYLDADPPRNAEAALFIARALDYRPDWTELRFPLARALRAIGDISGARHQLGLFLAGPNQGEQRDAALNLMRAIEKLDPLGAVPEALIDETEDAELSEVLGRTRAHLAKGRPEAAMAELRRLGEEKRGTMVLNLEAQILFSSGRDAEARDVLKKSLGKDPKQGRAHEQMGIILLSLGDAGSAKGHFEQAGSLGVESAAYHLACLEVPRDDRPVAAWWYGLTHLRTLVRVQGTLESYLKRSSPSVYRDDARVFLRDVDRQLEGAFITYGALFGVLLVTLLLWRWRRVSGGGLGGLIRSHPEVGAEVQRILSAIRHEILKHNTMVLGGLIEAIEEDHGDAAVKAKHFLSSLAGTSGREAVQKRLEFYEGELGKAARSYRYTLNLRHRDPAMMALRRGFLLLRRATPMLERYESLGRGKRLKLKGILMEAARLLNQQGYQAVQELLDSIRILEVDKGFIESIGRRIQIEPGLAGKETAFEVNTETDEPLKISVPRQAFEDIMANLIRNALQSSDACAVAMELEVDPITGFERAVFAVLDRSEQKLDLALFKQRNIESGLGLTLALISKFDGTLDVAEEDGRWKKSVRVKLPTATK